MRNPEVSLKLPEFSVQTIHALWLNAMRVPFEDANSGLLLDPFGGTEAACYVRWFNDPRILPWILPTTPKSYDDIASWISSVRDDPKKIYWGIKPPEMHNTPEIAGHIGITIDMDDSLTDELEFNMSFLLGPEHQKKGYATTSAMLLFEFLRTLGFRKLHTRVHEANTPSYNILKKIMHEEYSYESYSYFAQDLQARSRSTIYTDFTK